MQTHRQPLFMQQILDIPADSASLRDAGSET
jgi:hypothetical protein